MTEVRRHAWLRDVLAAVVVWAVSSAPVAVGLAVATTPGVLVHAGPAPDLLTACCYFDGGHYREIVDRGYRYDPERESTVAFFPGYPLAATYLRRLTGCDTAVALLVTSNAALVVALAVLSAYLRTRFPDEPATRLTALGLLGVWPVGFYFRIAYSESLFLAAVALLLLGLARRWPVAVLAVIAGAATGIRPVGVAASAAVLLHVLLGTPRGPLRQRLPTALALAPLSCWGLLVYMGYLAARFDDPLAFAHAQRHWSMYHPADAGPADKWLRLAAGEPLWNVYVPGSPRHWSRIDREPVLGLAFWNPIFFVVGLAAVALGWLRGWLTRPEAVLGLGLLLVPYLTRGYEMSMVSQGRFAAVAVPAFVVLGRGLTRLPPPVAWAVFAVCSPLLALWTALFAATWPLF